MTVLYDEQRDRLEEFAGHSNPEMVARLVGILIQKNILTFDEGMFIIQDKEYAVEEWRGKQIEKHLEKLVFGMMASLKG